MDDLLHQLRAGAISLGSVLLVCFALVFLRGVWRISVKLGERALLPLENRLFQWLQDRAMARALGVPLDLVQARRRIETADKPIDTHAEKPIRY